MAKPSSSAYLALALLYFFSSSLSFSIDSWNADIPVGNLLGVTGTSGLKLKFRVPKFKRGGSSSDASKSTILSRDTRMNMDLLHWDPGYCKVIIKQFTDTTLGSTDYYLDVALWYDLDTLVKPPPFLLFLLSLAHSSTALTHSLTRAAIPNQTDTRDRREDPRPLRRTPRHIIQVDARYADQNRPLRCVTAAVQDDVNNGWKQIEKDSDDGKYDDDSSAWWIEEGADRRDISCVFDCKEDRTLFGDGY
ncbi:MAG: hypothetical protein Q9190_002462 [Brigantiaea leucoxantha]